MKSCFSEGRQAEKGGGRECDDATFSMTARRTYVFASRSVIRVFVCVQAKGGRELLMASHYVIKSRVEYIDVSVCVCISASSGVCV